MRHSKTGPCRQLRPTAPNPGVGSQVSRCEDHACVCRQLIKSRAESSVKAPKTKPLFSPHRSSAKTQVFWCVFPKPKEQRLGRPQNADERFQSCGLSSPAQLPHLWKYRAGPPSSGPPSPGASEAITCGQPSRSLCLSAHLPRPRLGCLTPASARQEEKPRTAGKSSSSMFQRQKETNFGFRSRGKHCLSAIYVA